MLPRASNPRPRRTRPTGAVSRLLFLTATMASLAACQDAGSTEDAEPVRAEAPSPKAAGKTARPLERHATAKALQVFPGNWDVYVMDSTWSQVGEASVGGLTNQLFIEALSTDNLQLLMENPDSTWHTFEYRYVGNDSSVMASRLVGWHGNTKSDGDHH